MQLQWVSEWRIVDSTKLEKEYGWDYRVSNGGVYTNAKDLKEAKKVLLRNIEDEKRRYRIDNLSCPNCLKRFAEHHGMIDYQNCLLQLALDGFTSTKNKKGD